MNLWNRVLQALKSPEQKEAEEAIRSLTAATRRLEAEMDRIDMSGAIICRTPCRAPMHAHEVAEVLRAVEEVKKVAEKPVPGLRGLIPRLGA